MTDSFLARIPTLADAELRRYLEHPQDYKTEAVEAALAELGRRGAAVPEADLARVREALRSREMRHAVQAGRLLGTDPLVRKHRIRRVTAGILTAGLGAAALIYLRARPRMANPLGYEPEDTKKYLRELEVYGGKLNVLVTEFRHWFEGLWQGRSLAATVAVLTLLLAFGFWFVATRLAPDGEGR
ncbi:hypothetical protein [Geothrix alkalitolerans]|uniref:hypothetical protein n=1 Tax=Geothrix alkalitolerans TaxID=2922724 RepID=UPI001FB03EB5|nr:hypothetical protein [Geothrix alkalitolerans]